MKQQISQELAIANAQQLINVSAGREVVQWGTAGRRGGGGGEWMVCRPMVCGVVGGPLEWKDGVNWK